MENRTYSSASFINAERKHIEEDNSLPYTYGRTESYLLPQDPKWMFLFWDITNTTFDYIRSQNGQDIFDKSRSVVRLHDITDINFDGYNSISYTDVNVVLSARSWYLEAPDAGRKYVADIGIITESGKFILITRSNPLALPPGRVSDRVDEQWLAVQGDFEKLLEVSGAKYIGLGASEMSQRLADKWRDVLGAPSSLQSSNMSSKTFLEAAPAEEDDMWLRADCEIIVYGAASKGAKVTINGKEIELSEGTFYIRQGLQKGEVLDLPIKAEKNGMERNVKIKAVRED
ncbi:protein of unknown function (DUF4912) [Parelusimicrobium proximum]|uniref:DUF4912 domain-containing protein n=1 Tax=Parelusimicrobium proximum TaxID=3228953 RepID=UPI003D1697CF